LPHTKKSKKKLTLLGPHKYYFKNLDALYPFKRVSDPGKASRHTPDDSPAIHRKKLKILLDEFLILLDSC
jgi:hypothetical protein